MIKHCRASQSKWQELLQLWYYLLSISRHVHPPSFSTPLQILGFAKIIFPSRPNTPVYIPESLIAMASSYEGDLDEADEGLYDGYGGIEEGTDDDDAESILDLLFKLFQSMFRKVSNQTKKASRSILPAVLSPQLVSFAVDGTLLLAFLSIARALLEVVCNLGGAVFLAILLLRVIWAAVSYFQSSGNNSFSQSGSSFGAAT